MMDRRLPAQQDTFNREVVIRELAVEQRLDQLARFRPQTQRFFNPPCCADVETTWTYTLDLTGRTLDTWVDADTSTGVDFLTPPIPGGSTIISVTFAGTVVAGAATPVLRLQGNLPSEAGDTILFALADLTDPDPASTIDVTLPLALSSEADSLHIRLFPSSPEADCFTVEDLVIVITVTSPTVIPDVTDSWP
jgi:hypothetical protein